MWIFVALESVEYNSTEFQIIPKGLYMNEYAGNLRK